MNALAAPGAPPPATSTSARASRCTACCPAGTRSQVRGRGLAFEEVRGYLPGDDMRDDGLARHRAHRQAARARLLPRRRTARCCCSWTSGMNMFFGSAAGDEVRRGGRGGRARRVAHRCRWRPRGRRSCSAYQDLTASAAAPQPGRRAAPAGRRRPPATGLPACRGRRPAAAPPSSTTALDRARARWRATTISSSSSATSTAHGEPHARAAAARCAAHNDVLSVLVLRPVPAGNLPASGEMVVSDGELQVELGFAREPHRRGIEAFVQAQAHGAARVAAGHRRAGAAAVGRRGDRAAAPAARAHRHAVAARVPMSSRAPSRTPARTSVAASGITPQAGGGARSPRGPAPCLRRCLRTPQTAGWAVLGRGAGDRVAVAGVARRSPLAREPRYRREALAELARLSLDPAAQLAAVPPLLKRCALVAWPRERTAALSGPAWTGFVAAHARRRRRSRARAPARRPAVPRARPASPPCRPTRPARWCRPRATGSPTTA